MADLLKLAGSSVFFFVGCWRGVGGQADAPRRRRVPLGAVPRGLLLDGAAEGAWKAGDLELNGGTARLLRCCITLGASSKL